MMQKNDVQTSRIVELLTTAAKLPDPMQALALGYAKGLADAHSCARRVQPPRRRAHEKKPRRGAGGEK